MISNILNSDMKTKTGTLLLKQTETILKAISGMEDSEKPQSLTLPINPVDGESVPNVINDIMATSRFLKGNDFSIIPHQGDQPTNILIYIKPIVTS